MSGGFSRESSNDAAPSHLVEKGRYVAQDGVAIGIWPRSRELVYDRVESVRPIAELENLGGRVAEREAALGIEQEVSVFSSVPLEARFGGKPRTVHDG
jgi:hypothetical protein